MPSSRGSWLRDQNHVSCIGRRILYHWDTREAQIHKYFHYYRKFYWTVLGQAHGRPSGLLIELTTSTSVGSCYVPSTLHTGRHALEIPLCSVWRCRVTLGTVTPHSLSFWVGVSWMLWGHCNLDQGPHPGQLPCLGPGAVQGGWEPQWGYTLLQTLPRPSSRSRSLQSVQELLPACSDAIGTPTEAGHSLENISEHMHGTV